jgi:hypothetical protein
MLVSGQTRMQVMDIIDQMVRHITRHEWEKVYALTDREFSGYLWGGPAAAPIGKEDLIRYLKGPSGNDRTVIVLSDVWIHAEGTTAWFRAGCTVQVESGDRERSGKGVVTGVLRGVGHTWLFAQLHFTVPGCRE